MPTPNAIYVPDGQTLPVFRLGGRKYHAIKRLSVVRKRYQVRDHRAGPGGAMRAVHVLPKSATTRERMRVLQRVGEKNTNFPGILDYGLVDDQVVVVLPWIHGRTLHDYLNQSRKRSRRTGPGISVFEANRLFRGFAHGLSHFDRHKGLIHGDLKPRNLVLSRDPNKLIAIDFGSAWSVTRPKFRGDGDGYSEYYAAPEHLCGEGLIDFRSDHFSASVMFYEMLTLKLPYEGLGGKAALDPTCVEAFVPPSKLCRDASHLPKRIWKLIDWTVRRGVALDAEDRFPNSRSWLDALDEIRHEIDGFSKFGDRHEIASSDEDGAEDNSTASVSVVTRCLSRLGNVRRTLSHAITTITPWRDADDR